MKEPDFSLFDAFHGNQPREDWDARDATALHCMLNCKDRGQFIFDNLHALKDAGMYESMLFDAYTHGPHLRPMQWAFLFAHADFTKQDERWSKPTEPVTVYRGVACRKHRGWIRGLSWTTNPGTAAWFAERWHRPGQMPAVYTITAQPEHVYFMTNERREEEVVVAAWHAGKLKRLDPMPQAVKPE